LVRPPRLRARERTADEQLVRLLDGQTSHASNRRYGSSPCPPPSRPKPDSRSPPHGPPRRERVCAVAPPPAAPHPPAPRTNPRPLRRPHPGAEPVHRVVRLLHGLRRRAKREDGEDRPEDLLLRDPVALRDIREHRRREPVAALRQPARRLVDLRTLFLAGGD